MTGIVMMCAGGTIILLSTVGFYVWNRYLKKQKSRIQEEIYQIYE